jgi:hypothetical protein
VTTSPSWCCGSPTKAFLSHFIGGAEGIRTPDFRRAMADSQHRSRSRVFGIIANKHILSERLSYVFALVRLGCCTVAARGPHRKGVPSYLHIYPILLHLVLPTVLVRVRNGPSPQFSWIRFHLAA